MQILQIERSKVGRPVRTSIRRLDPKTKAVLTKLYEEDGAWTFQEMESHLEEEAINDFLGEAKILGYQDTDMGQMIQLLSEGRYCIGLDPKRGSYSLQTQLDKAFTRIAVRDLGWNFLSDDSLILEKVQRLFPYSKFRLAEIENETVVISGKLTGNGYSSSGIKRITDIVTSLALSENFKMVLVTPSSSKGQARASKYNAFLSLVSYLPRSQSNRFSVIQKNTSKKSGDKLSGAYITESTANLQKLLGVRQATLDVLLQSRSQRVGLAKRSLEIDGALSEAQLLKYYGLTIQDMEGCLATRMLVRPSKGKTSLEVQQNVVVADAKMSMLDDSDISHRLITAEIRHQLGIKSDEGWKVELRNSLGVEDPDAVYVDEHGSRVAIESDAGYYSDALIHKKLTAFVDQGYSEIIWGVVGNTRGKNISKRSENLKIKPQVVTVSWWSSEAEQKKPNYF